MVPGWAILGPFAAMDSGQEWTGPVVGAAIGVFFGLIFGGYRSKRLGVLSAGAT